MLKTCLRHEVAHYQAVKRTLWAIKNGMHLPGMTTEDRQFFSRLFDPEMREVEERLLRALRARPDFAREAQVPAELFENTFLLESACAQLERASTDLLGSLVDCVLTLRSSAHELNGVVERTVESLCRDPGTPWWLAQQLYTQWSEVALLEHLVQDRIAESRHQQAPVEERAGQPAAEAARSQQDLADLALLDEAAQGRRHKPNKQEKSS